MSKRATPEYLRTLNLNYEPHWKGVPSYLRVQQVVKHGERIFPHDDQVRHDYRVYFCDGTYDQISLSPVQETPVPGKFFCRIRAISRGSFVSWGNESEGMSAPVRQTAKLPRGLTW